MQPCGAWPQCILQQLERSEAVIARMGRAGHKSRFDPVSNDVMAELIHSDNYLSLCYTVSADNSVDVCK